MSKEKNIKHRCSALK